MSPTPAQTSADGTRWPSGSSPSWTDAVYDFAEFLAWEPQHLGTASKPGAPRRIADHVDRLRRMEVPLTNLTQAFLAAASPTLRRHVVEQAWGVDLDGPPEPRAWFRTLASPFHGYFQDDGALETAGARILMEAKVGAKFSRAQVAKNVWAHAILEHLTRAPKRPMVLLISGGPFEAAWPAKQAPPHRSGRIEGPSAWLGSALTNAGPPASAAKRLLIPSRDLLDAVADRVEVRHARWRDIAAALHEGPAEDADNLRRGFVAELERRGLGT